MLLRYRKGLVMNLQKGVVRMPGLQKMCPRSRSSIYAMIKAGTFPRPIKLGVRAVAWRVADIEEWLANLNQQND